MMLSTTLSYLSSHVLFCWSAIFAFYWRWKVRLNNIMSGGPPTKSRNHTGKEDFEYHAEASEALEVKT